MATGYTLEIGYVSGYSSSLNRDQRWEAFENYARQLIETPAMLVDESNRLKTPRRADEKYLIEVAQTYALPVTEGGPLEFKEINGDRYIFIMCSSGGEYRLAKESIARAFCRLMIYHMHTLGIDVDITVA